MCNNSQGYYGENNLEDAGKRFEEEAKKTIEEEMNRVIVGVIKDIFEKNTKENPNEMPNS